MIYSNGFVVDDEEQISFIPPLPTEETRGGITAKNRTTESIEVVIDTYTGRAYVADIDIATETSDGLMSKDDKKKLERLDNFKIESIDANIVVQDIDHRFVTDKQITAWNKKAADTLVTTESDGLMSIDDKKKLDGIEDEANNYVHPTSHNASMILQNATHRFVTDIEKTTWNNKADTTVASIFSNGLMSYEDKTKLDELGKVATQTLDGLMSMEDKIKLDSITTGANNYVHPDTHDATMIVEDITHRFVTDAEKSTWNAKADNTLASDTNAGLMSATDKVKVDLIPDNAVYTDTVYTHPDTHPASIIVQDTTHRFVSDEQILKIDNIPEEPVYTDTVYTHPATHDAGMIVGNETHRFVTDEQIATWNAKASTDIVTITNNGLMSSTDKTNLEKALSDIKTLESLITDLQDQILELQTKLDETV